VQMGGMQMMMQMPNGQVQQVQMPTQQGGPVQMMGMAMPAGMVAGMPGAMPAGMPGGMPAGAVMMVPGNYIGGPGGMVQQGAPQVGTSTLPVPGGATGSMPPALPQASAGGSPSEKAQPQTVTCAKEADGVFRVRWTVDARKLKGNDKTVVSPPFEIPEKATGTFKMMINPTPSKLKGGATFRNSNGKGSVQLKCDTASESRLLIRFSIGDGQDEPPRGPLEHNFALNGVCGLPKEVSEWDFTRVVDEAAKTFVVCLELL